MAVYPAKLTKLIRSPKFAKCCADPNGIGSDANFACGCHIRFFVSIDGADGILSGVGYETNGCGYMIAAAELIAAHISRKALSELHGLGREETGFILNETEAVQDGSRRDCIEAALNSVKSAFSNHRSKLLEEFAGEKALICTCFGISEETVEEFVAARRPTDSFQVSDAIRAGSGCGSCRMLIQEIIDSTGR